MLGYVTLGADDLAKAHAFYTSFLPALGFKLDVTPEGLAFTNPNASDSLPAIYIVPPFDQRPASSGNGTMVAFKVPTQQGVRDLHAAALAAGGSDEGAPGFRPQYSDYFYVAYLRDPQGNKIALFCADRNEPRRPT
jgi:catechol 2,3-dioxygenase-like lactoylglutathione lyase family enzyme